MLLAGNTFSQLGGVGVSGIVAVDGVVGGIALRENSFTEVTSGSETLTVSWVEGELGRRNDGHGRSEFLGSFRGVVGDQNR